MGIRNYLALVDSSSQRRAAITHCLAGSELHVEPFDSLNELKRSWPRTGTILLEDSGTNIGDLLEAMTDSGNWLPLIGLKEQPSTESVVHAILNGAIDYLEWPCSAEQLINAAKCAEISFSTRATLKLREARARSRVQRLTSRERQVLAGVADGLSNRLIGAQLEISPRTVEIHRANMLTKMGATHTSEAIRVAIEASLAA
jgi:FixJ family two-component response regulator